MEAFYGDTLWLKRMEETRRDGWLEFEDGQIGLHAIPSYIANEIDISSPPEPRHATPIKLIFEVDDLDATVRRLESVGVAVIERPWGAYDVIDPEGNICGIRRAAKV